LKTRDIKYVAVVGAGLMGHGIGAIFALHGHNVMLADISQELLSNARIKISEDFDRYVQAGLMDREQCNSALDRIRTTLDMREAVSSADLVVEAVVEKIDVKVQVFSQLDALAPSHAILASNTSGLPITRIASSTSRPDRVIGTHFWNPPLLMRAVEVVRGEQTSDHTVETTRSILEEVGKKPVVVSRDVPGQIGIRILYAMLREAISLVEKGVATPEDVDTVIREALGSRLSILGVLELADLSGLDLTLTVSNNLFKDLDASKEPQTLLREKVAQGETGVKSGKGFYDWSKRSAQAVIKKRDEHLLKLLKEA